MSLVISICHEKFLLSCSSKINMNQSGSSQTWSINWDILKSPNVLAKPGIISDKANSRSIGFLQLCNHNQVPQHQQPNRSGLHYFIAPTQNLSKMDASFCYIHSRSTTCSLRPCGTNVPSLYCQKSSFFLASYLYALCHLKQFLNRWYHSVHLT